MTRLSFYIKGLIWLGTLIVLLTACDGGETGPVISASSTTPDISTPSEEAAPSPSPLPPTATPVLLAARVNGLVITLEEYQAELALYEEASGTELATEDEQRVLNDMIEQALFAQAAFERGFSADEKLLEERLSALSDQMGGDQALQEWMKKYGYTQHSFERTLARSIGAAWIRDQIIAEVPREAEQVHARQILLYDPEQAEEVFSQLEAGNNFTNMATLYDPITFGDLGWFPRGFLTDPKLDEAAFSLDLEEYSPVIETSAGFHILQVLEYDPQRPLTPEALMALQTQAISDWLEARRSESDIEILLP